MHRAPPRKGSWITAALVVAAVALWAFEQKQQLAKQAPHRPVPVSEKARPSETAPPESPPPRRASNHPQDRYEVYEGCTLSPARNNDGDSFRVRLPDGREKEFRLYFVDTPESAFKRYSGGETNHQRIRQQAADLGGVTPEQAVEIGKQAKEFTLGLLAARPFTLFTEWDSPYHDSRYHAHIRVDSSGRTRWLHQLLIEKGFARIITKPADLPDGTPAAREKQYLRELEKTAKANNVGIWGM